MPRGDESSVLSDQYSVLMILARSVLRRIIQEQGSLCARAKRSTEPWYGVSILGMLLRGEQY
eukprot:2873292-Rhodomonas_salina.1